MRTEIGRRTFLRGGAVTALGLAGCVGNAGPAPGGGDTGGGEGADSGAWRTATLTEVRTGTEFRIDEMSTPLLLETFAVWCPTCLRQQRRIKALHEERGDAVTSVSLDVDPNEDRTKVQEHLDRHGFDWRFAVAPPDVTKSLIAAFGRSVTNPPSAPVIVVCDGGARRLGDGVKSSETLAEELDTGC